MRRVAFPIVNGRLAPVFDVAARVRVLSIEDGDTADEVVIDLPQAPPVARVMMMADAGIDTLVCGAISRPLLEMVRAYGITVIPFISGEVDRVAQALVDGDLNSAEFIMPGCRRNRHGRPSSTGAGKEAGMMKGPGRGGGRGGGGGAGGGGRGMGGGKGRMGGPAAGGPAGVCVCPDCGHREPHERGVPCNRKQCPECGATMSRDS